MHGNEGISKQGDTKYCAEMEYALIEYLDGPAKPAQRHIVEDHLAGCAVCRARAEEFRMLWGVLDDLPAITPSPAFDASLRARIAAEPVPHSFWNWLPSPRLAFATAALIAMSVWMYSIPQVNTNQKDLSSQRVATNQATTSQLSPEADFRMIRDLPVLENYDVVSNFDALSELPAPPSDITQQGKKETR
jgi:anti-sigma factor RsiW